MRTTIDINDSLLREAERVTRIHKKKALVEKALEELIRQDNLRQLVNMFGKGRLRLSLRQLNLMRRNE